MFCIFEYLRVPASVSPLSHLLLFFLSFFVATLVSDEQCDSFGPSVPHELLPAFAYGHYDGFLSPPEFCCPLIAFIPRQPPQQLVTVCAQAFLGAHFMISLLNEPQPSTFNDLWCLLTLFQPGYFSQSFFWPPFCLELFFCE